MKPAALALSLALLVVAGTLSLALPARGEDLSGSFGGDLRVAVQGFTGLDPTQAAAADRTVLELMYDALGRIDPVTLEVQPWAAASWAWDGDKNITVTLRRDLRFHDGSAYDADDVVSSLRKYERGGVARWSVSVVDALTVRFDFTAFNASAYDYRTTKEAGPGLFWTEAVTAPLAWDASGTRKYSGPFAVASFTPDPNPTDGAPEGRLVLSPNTYHFSGRPFLDSITYAWPYTVARIPRLVGNQTEYYTATDDAGCALMFRDVHFIGWKMLGNDLTDTRDCVASHGGFSDGNNRSLLHPDPAFSMPHVLTAKNPGTDFLYFGFSYSPGSLFIGSPGTQGQKLRSAIYQFVNKLNYRDIEPNTAITHGIVNRMNAPWAPANCPPWTPCDVAVDAGFVGIGTGKATNTGPGNRALDAAQVVDRDGDGIRELSDGTPISFQFLAPSFALGPRLTTMASDFALQLRSAAIDVSVAVFDTQAALDAAIANCTSCMYIARYGDATPLPDWIYTVPEIVNADDTDADLHLNLGAAASYSASARALHVGHVSHLVGASADLLPVLHYDALEAYDFQSFEGWVNTFDGINNVWSFSRLRLPALGSLTAKVSVFPLTGLRAGETTVVQAEVRDQDGDAVANATVTFSAASGSFANATGVTGSDGTYRTTYAAPATVAARTDVTILATVTRDQYVGTQASGALTLHPAAMGTLVVGVNRGRPVVDSNTTVRINITVTDGTGAAVSGAIVVVRTDLPGGVFSRTSGTTNATGVITVDFRAVVKQGMTYQILATASAPGYQEATGGASLFVSSDLGEVPVVETTRNVPGFEAWAAIGAVAVVFAVVALRRRRED